MWRLQWREPHRDPHSLGPNSIFPSDPPFSDGLTFSPRFSHGTGPPPPGSAAGVAAFSTFPLLTKSFGPSPPPSNPSP
ncbi:hypothetical protein Csa_021357 [Cucumis sativus]|nr:hypothetical protein Csa_021357 [Cucumis sativus]